MPRNIIRIEPIEKINRRDLVTDIGDKQVLSRENLAVIGSKNMKVKKLPGSSRLNATAVDSTGPITWIHRYYNTTPVARTFFFSQGKLYYTDENGNTSELLTLFSTNAYPSSVEMRVTGNDVLYFSEGNNTGMYSYNGNNGNNFQLESAVTLNFVGMISWLDRLWGFEENSEVINFSKNLVPTNFTDSTDAGQITIGASRGSKIMAIALLNETLYIFKNDSIWEVAGRTPSEFTVNQIVTNLGLAARRSLVKVESALIGFMSDYELHEFNGTQQTKLLTYDVALYGDLTKDLNPIVNVSRLDQICAAYHNYIYRMAFCAMDSSTIRNDMEYCRSSINEIDFFTRGNSVSAYCVYDRPPDRKELITGRSDTGRLMRQYQGLNWDNDAAGATMSIKTQTKFYGSPEPQNFRVRRYWGNFGVLGARNLPIKMFIDARNANSDSTSDELITQGETKSMAMIRINSQLAITSRQIPRHNNSKCQNFSLMIDQNLSDIDLEFSSFNVEVIQKNIKRSQKVGV